MQSPRRFSKTCSDPDEKCALGLQPKLCRSNWALLSEITVYWSFRAESRNLIIKQQSRSSPERFRNSEWQVENQGSNSNDKSAPIIINYRCGAHRKSHLHVCSTVAKSHQVGLVGGGCD